MLIVMIVAYLDILKHGDGIIGEGCQREVLREQIRGYTKLIKSHQSG